MAAVAAIAIVQGAHDTATPPRNDSVRVVAAGTDVPAIRSGATIMLAPARPTVASIDRLLAEGSQSLRGMHDAIALQKRDDRAAIDEARLRGLFTVAILPGLTDLTIKCGSGRCEVHGIADGDDTTVRLALRDPNFQDKIATLGYTAGSDLISGRGERSELLIYLDKFK